MASDDTQARVARKRELNDSMIASLVNQSKTLTVLSFSRDQLAPATVGDTADGATGGCDGILILSPTQQGYSQRTRSGDVRSFGCAEPHGARFLIRCLTTGAITPHRS